MAFIQSIQTGRIAPLGIEQVPSGFVKTRVDGAVQVETLGIVGDEQADLSVHGGPDKAVYFYPAEHYPRWAADSPKHADQFMPGGFGENITSMGFDEQSISIGDVLLIGSCEMQVTQPRQPCFKLALRFADNSLVRMMMHNGRSGWYVRVLKTGQITAGEEIKVIDRPSPQWTIQRFNQLILHRAASDNELRELVTLEGLAKGWRDRIDQGLRA